MRHPWWNSILHRTKTILSNSCFHDRLEGNHCYSLWLECFDNDFWALLMLGDYLVEGICSKTRRNIRIVHDSKWPIVEVDDEWYWSCYYYYYCYSYWESLTELCYDSWPSVMPLVIPHPLKENQVIKRSIFFFYVSSFLFVVLIRIREVRVLAQQREKKRKREREREKNVRLNNWSEPCLSRLKKRALVNPIICMCIWCMWKMTNATSPLSLSLFLPRAPIDV